jgi:hypothetical protein
METSVHVRVQSSVMGSDRQEEWCWRDRRSGVGETGGVVLERQEEWCWRDRRSGVGETGGVVLYSVEWVEWRGQHSTVK